MRFTAVLFYILFSSALFSQGIEFFHGEWQEALEQAEKSDKLLFVDAYAQWCGPCKRMAKEVFTKEEVGSFFNDNFINLKLDMETEDGRAFGKKYPVSAYPTLFFVNGKGEIVKKVTGGKKANDLISLGKVAIQSYDRSGDYAVQYEEGDRSFDLMYNYVKELNKVNKPSLKISNEYISSNPEISAAQKAKFLMVAVTESDARLFDELLTLKQEAIKGEGKEAFEDKVRTACLKAAAKAVEYDYEDLVTEAVAKYKEAKVGDR